jgi:hypothetical protein
VEGESEVRRSRIDLPERPDLLFEEFERDPSVELRVIETAAEQAAVPVVLDQPVVWVARIGERVQAKRVDDRQLQNLKAVICGGQMGEVVIDDVVTDQEI